MSEHSYFIFAKGYADARNGIRRMNMVNSMHGEFAKAYCDGQSKYFREMEQTFA